MPARKRQREKERMRRQKGRRVYWERGEGGGEDCKRGRENGTIGAQFICIIQNNLKH